MSGLSFLARFCQTDSQFGQFAARSWCSPLRLVTRPSRKPQPSMVSSLNATYLPVSFGTFSSSVMPCESPKTATFGTVAGRPAAGGVVVGDPDGPTGGERADADGDDERARARCPDLDRPARRDGALARDELTADQDRGGERRPPRHSTTFDRRRARAAIRSCAARPRCARPIAPPRSGFSTKRYDRSARISVSDPAGRSRPRSGFRLIPVPGRVSDEDRPVPEVDGVRALAEPAQRRDAEHPPERGGRVRRGDDEHARPATAITRNPPR